MTSESIGIDLGTTACCVAVYRADGRVEVIPNGQGNFITPSYVAFSDNQRLIGEEAKAQVYHVTINYYHFMNVFPNLAYETNLTVGNNFKKFQSNNFPSVNHSRNFFSQSKHLSVEASLRENPRSAPCFRV